MSKYTIYGQCKLFNLDQDFNSKEEAMAKYDRLLQTKMRSCDWDSLEVVDQATREIVAATYNH